MASDHPSGPAVDNKEDYVTAKQLQQLRIHTLQLTQEALATQLGVSTNTVARWEQGVHPIAPSMAKLIRLIAKG